MSTSLTAPPTGRPTVGVLAGWQVYAGTLNTFLSQLLRGIRAAAAERDCNLLIACGLERPLVPTLRPAWPTLGPDQDFVPVGPWNTSGLIVITPLSPDDPKSRDLEKMLAAGHPIVFAGVGQGKSSVSLDNAGGIRQALDHLWRHGHRRIAFVAGVDGQPGDSQERLEAYVAFLRRKGPAVNPRLWAHGHFTFPGGRAAMQRILASGEPFTALVASNDESAIGAMQALRDAGLRIPEDVAVVGFDNRFEARAQIPPLTSVHQPAFDIGFRALELALDRIAGRAGPAATVCVPASLVVRQSCGCPAGAAVSEAANRRRAVGDARLARDMTRAVLAEARQLGQAAIERQCRAWIDALRLSARTSDEAPFAEAVARTLNEVRSAMDDPLGWQTALDILRAARPQAALPDGDGAIDAWLAAARAEIGECAREQHVRWLATQNDFTLQLSLLTAHLAEAATKAQALAILRGHLPGINVRRADVYLFRPEGSDPVAWSAPADDDDDRFRTREFPPTDAYPAGQPFRLALLPLVIDGSAQGFVAFDAENLEPCAAVTRQLASAFRSAKLHAQAEEGRRLAEEAARLKARFLSTVSHELLTPLSVIVGACDTLMSDGAAANRETVSRLRAGAQHLGHLIRDVLDLAGSDAGHLRLAREPFDLAAAVRLVSEVGSLLAQDKHLHWQTTVPADVPPVLGDRTRVQQVMLNLITNAVKFTERGRVWLDVTAGSDHVTVSVSDTGLGIPQAEREAIFDEFRQSERTAGGHFGGLGLGLSICKRLVELNGGHIGVTSSGVAGEGSTFWFTLPVAARARVRADSEPDGVVGRLLSVLVADDEPTILEVHTRIAQSLPDLRVVARARTGLEALRALRETQPDVLLLDLMMPELDGFGVLDAMRADPSLHDTIVVVLTAQSLSERDMARLGDVAAVIEKGVFGVDELRARLEAVLARNPRLGTESRRLARKAIAFMHEHHAEPLTADRIAQHVGISRGHLTRCFRDETGVAPITYLNRYRVLQARIRLETTNETITSVASATGFDDVNYFSRIFRKELGMSPTEYRRRHPAAV